MKRRTDLIKVMNHITGIINGSIHPEFHGRKLFHAFVCPDCGTLHIVPDSGYYKCALCGHTFEAVWQTTEYQYMKDTCGWNYDLVCSSYNYIAQVYRTNLGIRFPLCNGTFASSPSDTLTEAVDVEKLFKMMPASMSQATEGYSRIVLPSFKGDKRFKELVQENKSAYTIQKKRQDKVHRFFANLKATIAYMKETREISSTSTSSSLDDETIGKAILALILLT